MRKTILLWLTVHTEAKCLLELSVWFEKLKRNDCDTGKPYNLNHNLWRGRYKAGHKQKSGRTPMRRNAEVWENIWQFCNLYS